MKARHTLLALGLAAALSSAAAPSFAQNATLKVPAPVAASAGTSVPALVPFSGVAFNNEGKALTGEASVNFLIFKDEQGGEPLWAETQTVVVDASGRYKVHLGGATPSGLPADLFLTGEARWLEVQVVGETPQPRVLLASVPYALKAADAATLGGMPASAFALAGTTPRSVAGAASPAVVPDVVSTVTTTGGVANTLAKFSGTNTIVDSILFDNGTDVGIGTTTPAAKLDIDGTTYLRGDATIYAAATATATAGSDSRNLILTAESYDSSTAAPVKPSFLWKAEPTGNNTATPNATLNLLSTNGIAAAAETGLFIKPNGTINFAAGQTFPGTGAGTITGVTAGTALTGGGVAGDVTLNLDTTKVPLLSTANTFAASQSVTTGDFSLGSTFNATTGVINIGGIPFLHGYSKGNDNVFVGGAGNFTTTGSETAAVGYAALSKQSSGFQNTAIGVGALELDTTGYNNTAVGDTALFSNTVGDDNTAIGASSGPVSAGLSNTTAVGWFANVGQSNTLVLGNAEAANPGAEFVNVGIGTATPVSALETSVAASALGPVLTITNPAASSNLSTAAAIDFNTLAISTTGTYNPTARIEAVDNGFNSSDISFLSNTYGGRGGPTTNNGLQTNMTIFGYNGAVTIGSTVNAAQLAVFSNSSDGVWAFGGSEPDESMFQGLVGLRAGGGESSGTDTGGLGAWIFGGDVVDIGSTGTGGDGMLVEPGGGQTEGLAADFEGDVFINGTLNANVKDFKIDHPLDPANKYLVHTSVESSEMMNIYTGNVTTDELGLATVTMPGWFSAENTDFRYQLTVVDERFAQAVVSKRMNNNQFTIHTNASNVEVSWQVTAVRQDAYAKAHPLVVEQDKNEKERGFYQHPELYGQPKEKQTQWGVRPRMMRKMLEDKQKMREERLSRAKKTGGNSQLPATAVGRKFSSPSPLPKRQPVAGIETSVPAANQQVAAAR